MINKILFNRKVILLAIILICLSAVTAVSAADNATDEISAGIDNMEENTLTASPDTFTDLNSQINDNNDSDVYLNVDYRYASSDSNYSEGIEINRAVTIHGNGHTIDANNSARIFNVMHEGVIFKNLTLINGYSKDHGGAIKFSSPGSAINCIFIGNNVGWSGGAIYYGNAENSTFIGNSAYSYGGAIYRGNAVNCTFKNNAADKGGAIYYGNADQSTFIGNSASYGGAVTSVYCTNSIFKSNSASYGGASYYGNALKSTFINNSAAKTGGAIYDGDAEKCSFIGNSAKNYIDVYGNMKDCLFVSYIYVSPLNTFYNEGKILKVVLKDHNYNVVSNAQLAIKISNKVTKTLKTNSKGEVTLTTNGMTPGIYTATITFAGNNYCLSCTKSIKITVKKANSKFIASNKAFKVKATKKATAILKDAKNKIIKNRWVTFKVNGKSYKVKTNSKGVAQATVKITKKGSYKTIITFAGDKCYNKATKTIKLTIK